MNINSVHVSPKAVTMTPGNPDSITHAFAAEDKKANEVLEKVKAAIDGSGVSIWLYSKCTVNSLFLRKYLILQFSIKSHEYKIANTMHFKLPEKEKKRDFKTSEGSFSRLYAESDINS